MGGSLPTVRVAVSREKKLRQSERKGFLDTSEKNSGLHKKKKQKKAKTIPYDMAGKPGTGVRSAERKAARIQEN